MAYKEAGNLAYQITDDRINTSSVSFNSNAVPEIPFELPDLPERRKEEYEREKRRRRILEKQYADRAKEIYVAATKERAKNIAYYVFTILSILGIFAFLMIRQSQIIEHNFNNTRLQNQIKELEQNNQKTYEEMLSRVDLVEIEKQAAAIYGLRKPAASQRIKINLPEVDKVIRYSNTQTDDTDTQNSSSEERRVVEDFSQTELQMRRLRIQE